MSFEIEIVAGGASRVLRPDRDRLTIGKSPENDISLEHDSAASRLHAVLERFPAGWCITDLGSSNGTWTNGARTFAAQRLRDADEIRVGQSLILIRDPETAGADMTETEASAPPTTPREHDLLLALCRPLLARDMFTEPASTRTIAEEMVVTPAAVKQHLVNLYKKFKITADEESSRRLRLANEALRCGVISLGDLHRPDVPEHR